MATARKPYFKVWDKIRREPWDNDELALATRLMAIMHERWARDRTTWEEAAEVLLDSGELCSLAGCQSLVRARRTIVRLAAHSSLTFVALGTRTLVRWRKFSEIQGSESEVRVKSGSTLPANGPPPETETETETESKKKKKNKSSADALPRAARAARSMRLAAPDQLLIEQLKALTEWNLSRPDPLDSKQLNYAIEHVLEWGRAKGELKADWVATIRNAIREGWALRGYNGTGQTGSQRWDSMLEEARRLAGAKPQ